MTRELSAKVTIDHTNGLRRITDHSYNRTRTINLRFTEQADGQGYLVQAWGSAFPEDGGGGYQGHLPHSVKIVNSSIDVLREAWQKWVIRYKYQDKKTGRIHYPFADQWDLATPIDSHRLGEVGLALAKAGHSTFKILFTGGDNGMREITKYLVRALRNSENAITVMSDQLFVPWGMLYTPLAGDSVRRPGDEWSLDGFWGYRHLVEHSFSRTPGFDSRISIPANQVIVGLNVDKGVDHQYPQTPYIKPVIDFFNSRTKVILRCSKDELAGAFQDPFFPDHITYFGCHGEVSGSNDRVGQPFLKLEDNEEIYGADLIAWLSESPLATQPLVFIGTCQGGQLASMFYPGFGHELLKNGARCLVGPQIDLPPAFACEYTTRLFSAFLDPGVKLGDIIRSLARNFADEHANPLGLMFSLYRGMDVHLWPAEVT